MSTELNAQSQPQQLSRDVLGSQDKIVIPYSYFHGFIVLDVVFQKMLPLRFILDTGAEHSILLKKEYPDMLRLGPSKRIRLYGSDMSSELYALIYRNTFLQLANTQTIKHDVIVLEEDFLKLEEFVGTSIDGILGAEFFRGLILQIDYKKQHIIIHRPSAFQYNKLDDFEKLEMDIIANKPYLNCITEVSKGKSVKTKLLVDTGAALTVLFHNNTDSLLAVPDVVVKGNLGKGLGGDIEGYTGKVHKLTINNLMFVNMLSSFQDLENVMLEELKLKRNGLLGNLFLERFSVVFDFSKSHIYLKPGKNYNKEFEYDKSGLTVFAFGKDLNQFYVKYVMAGSPADEAGIKPGDIIKKIGFWSYKWFTLTSIHKKMMGKPGKKVKFTLLRDGKTLKKELTLRDLFD
ncbi:MAG: aspartyl protease family protein [Saprospiraceae bacterium]|nr:aspartyl protease family protein [Saprospiraceae bacterium]